MKKAGWRMESIAVAFALALLWFGAAPAAAEKVTFALDWVPYGKHAGWYAALEKGYFKEEGLTVNIIRGHGSGDTVKVVASKGAEFGFADASSLIIARGNTGVQVKEVAMGHHKSLFCIYVLKKTGVRGPKDLSGKTIGSAVGNAARVTFPALAKATGLNPDTVKWIDMPPPSQAPSLFGERVDAIVTYATIGPTYFEAARKSGKPVLEYLFSDYGVDLYSNGIITRDDRIKGNPEQVRRFVRASMRGLAFAVEHPDEAVKIFLKSYPTFAPRVARQHLDIMNRHLLTPTTKKTGIGFMTKEKMKLTRDVVAKYFKLKRLPKLEEIYTNEFVPKIFPKAPSQ
ncbi:MAG: ABC transporter substrate-binding protein [Nitrospinota bacterium]